jgi:DNA topoisomerase IB
MPKLTYNNLIERLGKKRGHFSNKANRIAKLIDEWKYLESKFCHFIEKGNNCTPHARLAYAVLLMMHTGIRTGNESSAEGWICENQIIARKDNPEKGIKTGDVIWRHPCFGQHVQTFGLTTLQHRHIRRRGDKYHISFVGKKLVDQKLVVDHPVLVEHCPLKGKPQDLFLGITYHDLKKFVYKYVGKAYTPKDLRMAKVNLIFLSKFKKVIPEFEKTTTKGGRKKIVSSVIEDTANWIGHTKSVCRSAYMSQPLLEFLLSEYQPIGD